MARIKRELTVPDFAKIRYQSSNEDVGRKGGRDKSILETTGRGAKRGGTAEVWRISQDRESRDTQAQAQLRWQGGWKSHSANSLFTRDKHLVIDGSLSPCSHPPAVTQPKEQFRNRLRVHGDAILATLCDAKKPCRGLILPATGNDRAGARSVVADFKTRLSILNATLLAYSTNHVAAYRKLMPVGLLVSEPLTRGVHRTTFALRTPCARHLRILPSQC